MISLTLSVEDVACPVDDMRKSYFGWGSEGRENKGSGYKINDGLSEGAIHDTVGGARLWRPQETPARHGRVMDVLRHHDVAPRPYTVQWALGWRFGVLHQCDGPTDRTKPLPLYVG